jgi:hypothetical protein
MALKGSSSPRNLGTTQRMGSKSDGVYHYKIKSGCQVEMIDRQNPANAKANEGREGESSAITLKIRAWDGH